MRSDDLGELTRLKRVVKFSENLTEPMRMLSGTISEMTFKSFSLLDHQHNQLRFTEESKQCRKERHHQCVTELLLPYIERISSSDSDSATMTNSRGKPRKQLSIKFTKKGPKKYEEALDLERRLDRLLVNERRACNADDQAKLRCQDALRLNKALGLFESAWLGNKLLWNKMIDFI
ncbi:hypothetical protein PSTG_14333 [Puccinia striiformis f. sp. tritici PST-78]|uniref:Uncharacterized protein n=1 Tax=Puccinia striiformis f. sp. tritici PST-78 TaxID=1165861 RepID=A0A0L0UZP0_9BASI|nr:hypothetical protein PSTG_14333 [Puccinia striiformis f. sp. tritici PST-78]